MAATLEQRPPNLPPPRSETGVVGWMRANLFGTWYNSLLTAVLVIVIVVAVWFGGGWTVTDADWTVIGVLGGQMVIGQYNIESSCPGQNCFWRPQVGLLLVTFLFGMGWAVAGAGVAKRIALAVAIVSAAFSLLPYSFEEMGMDVRLLLIANLPAVFLGWAIARYTPLGTPRWIVILAVAFFLITLVLLRGIESVPRMHPVSFIHLIPILLGMAWAVAGGSVVKWIALTVAIVFAAFSLLPPGLVEMGMGVRLFFLANLPAVFVGWAIARYTPLGTPRRIGILAVVLFLIILVFLRGIESVPGIPVVSFIHWGGITLNILLAVAGITLSLPIGIALALGRRSALPVVKLLCVVFIEVFRGVPLITLLFMSQVLVPLAFPEDLKPNSLLRAAIVITLFSAAYMAENIRGGLQALHPGQVEAARALGLPGWQTTLFISLPQAIRNVIPAIVGQFISLFKDTSLVYIIGMLDIVEISRAFIQGNTEYLSSAKELFIFLALVFWIFTYTMSYVSGRVERHLGVGQR